MYLYSASSRNAAHRFPYTSTLISASQPPARHQRTLRDHGYRLVYHAICLFTLPAFAGYLFQPPRTAGSGWVGLDAWFCAEVVYPSKDDHLYPDTNLAWRRVAGLIESNCYLYTKPATQYSMKQETFQFALEWCHRTQEFQVGRQPTPSTGRGNRESPVISLPTRSWYDQVTVTQWTLRPWKNDRGGHQQAGNVIGNVPDEHLVFSTQ